MRAVLDVFADSSMSCSCRLCPANSTYRWYKIDNGQARLLIGSKQRVMTPEERGTYACRFVWTEGRSLLSNVHSCKLLLIEFDMVSLYILLQIQRLINK